MSERPTTRLKSLLSGSRCIVAPGVADAFAARMVAMEGFEACYMTGFGTSLTRLGMPDIGLLTMSEMVDNAARIVDACALPLVADADTGYGNPMNVRRTIHEYERAGVAAVHLEDQAWPKRCGHLAGKRVIPVMEMEAKLKAAVDSRRDPDFLVIARTDAIAVEGFDAALERAERYRAAGADVLFVEAPTSTAQLEQIGRRFAGIPLLYNMAASGKTPDLDNAAMARLGFRIAIFPNWLLLAAIPAMRRMLKELKQKGGVADIRGEVATFKEFTEIAGLPEVQALEDRYGLPEDQRAGL
ncbi:MAG: isocitrate lyase/PEP mutase family protein [Burkholderiales bacterium]|nr:isocitrate lyase/PEP mutase family protein [Burkholderiales bacterium]